MGSKSSIVICMGDNGAVVLSIVAGCIRNKYFVDSVDSEEWVCIIDCLSSSKKARIYVVLEHSNQVYSTRLCFRKGMTNYSFSNTSGLSNIVYKDGYNAVFPLPEEQGSGAQTTRQCLCVESCMQDKVYEKFLGIICEHCVKNFAGVYLLPIELVGVAQVVASRTNVQKKWIVFVVCTKVGDFRKIVLCNGTLFSTATIKIERDERDSSSTIASKIYNDMLDSQKKILSEDPSSKEPDVGLYMVVPGSIKSSLLSFNLQDVSIKVMTPYELGKALQVQDCVSVSSIYCDTVILYTMLQEGLSKSCLSTEGTSTWNKANIFKRFAVVPTFCVIAIVVMLNTFYTVEIFNSMKKVTVLNEKSQTLSSKLVDILSDREFSRINEMYEVVDLYRSLSNSSADPMEIILPLSKIPREDFSINRFTWSIEKDFSVTVELGVVLRSGSNLNLEEVLSTTHTNYTVKNIQKVRGKPGYYTVYLSGRRIGDK